jgi:hypothetical protein
MKTISNQWVALLVGLLAGLSALNSLADEVVNTGKVYALGSNRKQLLFTLKRTETTNGTHGHVTEIFLDPTGKQAVRMDGEFENGKIYSYTLDENQTGEKGQIDIKGDHAYFQFTTASGKQKKDDEKLGGLFVIGLSFKKFIRDNWDKFLKGDSVDMRFGVPDRLETVGFKMFKDGEAKIDGHDVIVLEMKPTSFVIAAIVKPLYFYYDKNNSDMLVMFKGRTIPKLKDGNDYKDLDAETVYDLK